MFKFSNSGSPIRDIRSAIWKNGELSVEVVGQENLQDFINSYADSCNIELLVARAMNGEPEVLQQRNGMYGDFTQYPKTYAEMVELMVNAKSYFENLPLEIRNKFNNDPMKFISEMDDKDWLEKAGFIEKVDSKVESEVKDNES